MSRVYTEETVHQFMSSSVQALYLDARQDWREADGQVSVSHLASSC